MTDKEIYIILTRYKTLLRRRATSNLRAQNANSVFKDAMELEILERLEKKLIKKNSIELKPILFLVFAGISLLLGSMIRMPHTTLDLATRSSGLIIEGDAWYSDEDLHYDVIRVEDYSALTGLNGVDATVASGQFIELVGRVTLTQLHWLDSTTVEILNEDNFPELSLIKGVMRVELKLDSGMVTLGGGSTNQLSTTTEDLEIELLLVASDSMNPSLRLIADSIRFGNFTLRKVSFLKRDVSGMLSSSLQSGLLNFNEKKAIEKVTSRDTVKLFATSNSDILIDIKSKHIETRFSGSASSVTKNGIELKPSLLEFIYKSDQYAFFWATGSFIVGLIWSIYNLFKRE